MIHNADSIEPGKYCLIEGKLHQRAYSVSLDNQKHMKVNKLIAFFRCWDGSVVSINIGAFVDPVDVEIKATATFLSPK